MSATAWRNVSRAFAYWRRSSSSYPRALLAWISPSNEGPAWTSAPGPAQDGDSTRDACRRIPRSAARPAPGSYNVPEANWRPGSAAAVPFGAHPSFQMMPEEDPSQRYPIHPNWEPRAAPAEFIYQITEIKAPVRRNIHLPPKCVGMLGDQRNGLVVQHNSSTEDVLALPGRETGAAALEGSTGPAFRAVGVVRPIASRHLPGGPKQRTTGLSPLGCHC